MVALETLFTTARRLNAKARSSLPPLLFLTDDLRTPDPGSIIASLPRDSAVIFRHYAHPQRGAFAERLRAQCKARDITFLIAGDPHLAARVRADGIHLPEQALRTIGRNAIEPGRFVTAAAHGTTALLRAARFGADAVLISPVFSTASHPGGPTLGILRFAALAETSQLPVYALGGITADTAPQLIGTRAIGIAAIGAFTKRN